MFYFLSQNISNPNSSNQKDNKMGKKHYTKCSVFNTFLKY